MELRFPGQAFGMFQGILEVVAKLYQFSAQGTHRGILFLAVVMRNNDHGSESAIHCGESHALPKLPLVAAITPFTSGAFRRSSAM